MRTNNAMQLKARVDNRVTKDLDTTVQGFALTHESAESVFRDIIAIDD